MQSIVARIAALFALVCSLAVADPAQATATITPPAGWWSASVLVARWAPTGAVYVTYRGSEGCVFVLVGADSGMLFDSLTIVHGTEHDDEMRLLETDGVPFCGNTWNRLQINSTQQIHVDGRGGADLFLTGATNSSLRYRMYGGPGDDRFLVGNIARIYAGDGADMIITTAATSAAKLYGEAHGDAFCILHASPHTVDGGGGAGNFDAARFHALPTVIVGIEDTTQPTMLSCETWRAEILAWFTD